MTIIAYPLDTVTYGGEATRQALSALTGVAPVGRPLGAQSGVRPGSPSALVSATATTWTVGIHSGVLDLETSATTGPYYYAISVAETGSMTAANATNPRIDLISLQVNDNAEGDGSGAESVTVVYTVGTPAASPVVPATPARNYALASISVPASGGGAPSVTQLYKAWDRRLGATVAINVGFTTDSAFTGVATWSWPEDNGGFTSGGTSGNSTPLTVPAGLGGLYVVSWVGALNVAVTGTSFVQINGMPYITRAMHPAGTNSQGQSAGGTVRLADGATLGLTIQMQNGGTSKTLTGQLSLYRIGS